MNAFELIIVQKYFVLSRNLKNIIFVTPYCYFDKSARISKSKLINKNMAFCVCARLTSFGVGDHLGLGVLGLVRPRDVRLERLQAEEVLVAHGTYHLPLLVHGQQL